LFLLNLTKNNNTVQIYLSKTLLILIYQKVSLILRDSIFYENFRRISIFAKQS